MSDLHSSSALIDAEIRRAWALRRAQRMEECMEIVGQLRHELGLRSTEVPTTTTSESAVQTAEVMLLSASLARFQSDSTKCRLWTEAAERLLASHHQPGTFSLYFEKARALFFESDYSAALEIFVSATAAAKEPIERLYSQTNVLLCLENLGLPFERTLAEVEVLARGPAANDEIRDQVEAFGLRQSYRDGNLSLFQYPREDAEIRQAGYYQLWVRQLPYHAAYTSSTELENIATRASRLYYRAFRLRTLAGTTHPDDAAFAKRTELADRAYLWVWRWLCAPEQFSLSKVTATLASIRQVPDYQWGLEDGCLVANAIGWLSLFDPSLELRETRPPNNHASLETQAPILYFERLLIGYLAALRNAQPDHAADYLRELRAHPLCQEKSLHLSLIVEAVAARRRLTQGPLAPLVANLLSLIQAPEEAARRARFRVDLKILRITDLSKDRFFDSEPMAIALQLLHGRASIRRSELLASCFGITRYEPVNHDAKIFNLLSRLRSLGIPQLRFRVKGDLVMAEGRWAGVEFIEAPSISRRLQADGSWRAMISESARPRTRQRPSSIGREVPEGRKTLPRDGRLRRPELEAWLGKSRATTNRLLAVWVRRKWARAEGGSHQTCYVLDPRLVEILEKEGPAQAPRTLQRTSL